MKTLFLLLCGLTVVLSGTLLLLTLVFWLDYAANEARLGKDCWAWLLNLAGGAVEFGLWTLGQLPDDQYTP